MSATVAAALKKIAVYILTDKKALKVVGGIILGIIIIIIMPIVALLGIFTGSVDIDTERLHEMIAEQQSVAIESWSNVETAMTNAGYDSLRIQEAQLLFTFALYDHTSESDFASKLVGCFTAEQTDEELISAVNAAFGTNNARQFLKMEKSFRLAEFVDRMHSLTNQFVADAIDRQVEGEYKVSLAPIRNKVVNDSFSASLFMEMLSERPEIAEVDYDYENDTVSVALADEHIRFTDESGMRYLTEQDIEVMCAKHILWLNDEGGEQADFSNCVIRGMDLSRRNLNQAIFDGAKISNTQLYSAELCYASCVGTKFYNCYATDLTAEEASFKGAEFIGTELGRSVFTHSNFTDARFRNCEVYSCSLDGSCIEGTDFGDTDTSLVRMNRCTYDEDIWNAEQNGSPITM